MGKPQIKKKQEVKAPISKGWIGKSIAQPSFFFINLVVLLCPSLSATARQVSYANSNTSASRLRSIRRYHFRARSNLPKSLGLDLGCLLFEVGHTFDYST